MGSQSAKRKSRSSVVGTGYLPSWASFAAVSFIAVAAAALRAWVNFSGPLVPKVNGAYYLVQVRALLERGRLALHDLPLAFLLESAAARLLRWPFGLSTDRAVMLAVKLVDTIVPPLAAVPASLLAFRLRPAAGEASLLPASCATPSAAAAFWVALSCSPIALSGDFHKNAVGMLWMVCLAASLPGALERRPRSIAAAAGWLALAAVTHLGAFGTGLALVVPAAAATLLFRPRPQRRRAAFAVACLAAAAVGVLGYWLLLDPSRRERLAALPRSLFRRPYLLSLLGRRADGVSGSPSAIADLALQNAIAIAGIVVLARRWRSLGAPIRAIAVAGIASCLFLASPFIGTGWAERFHLMAYAPAAVVLAFTAPRFGGPAVTRITVGVVTTASLALSLLTLRTKISQEFGVDPSAWDEYERVYFLVMNRPPDGDAPHGDMRSVDAPGGASRPDAMTAFPEVRVSGDAVVVHEGRFFTLWRADTAPAWYPLASPPEPAAHGRGSRPAGLHSRFSVVARGSAGKCHRLRSTRGPGSIARHRSGRPSISSRSSSSPSASTGLPPSMRSTTMPPPRTATVPPPQAMVPSMVRLDLAMASR